MSTQTPELAEAHLRGLLASLGLDVEYHRGDGDTLYYRDQTGTEVPVVDFVGGYGSLIFGHHHPELVDRARQLLADQVPLHAQFSYHPYANELAHALTTISRREFKTEEPFFAIFANSGAEAVECAMKHAELERAARIAALSATVEADIAAVTDLVRSQRAALSPEGYPLVGQVINIDELVNAVRVHNSNLLNRPPWFLALEGGFHGKLVGSVQLTHNPGYREPFRTLAAQTHFVPVDLPGAVAEAIATHRSPMLSISSVHGIVRLVEYEFPTVAAFFVEPVQGEGGIRPVPPAFAAEINEATESAGIPIVVDEIQTGVGRTGSFFAASQIGLRADYVVLAKSLGGGLAKSAAMLVRAGRYRNEFELLHSSTFAKDAYSCYIGLAVVRMLEQDGGSAYRLIDERGRALVSALREVQREFPDVVAEVRGKGLMVGLEFRDPSSTTSQVIREFADGGLFGYLLAGYLLREHRLRVFPTASATNTLRFEPSLRLPDEAVTQLAVGLRALCELIRQGAGEKLLSPKLP